MPYCDKILEASEPFIDQIVKREDLKEKYKEYLDIIKEQPEITDEEVLFIKNIVSENIGKDIELKRDEKEENRIRFQLRADIRSFRCTVGNGTKDIQRNNQKTKI